MGNNLKRIKILATSVLILFVMLGAKKSYSQHMYQPAAKPDPKPEAEYSLLTAVSPAGAGSISPAQGSYKQGTNVILTAQALEGWQFDHWSGTDNDAANPTSVAMNANKQVMAFFIRQAGGQTPAKSQASNDNKITVAVYPIKITGADKSLEPVLTSLYITKLSQSARLKVIEEAMMDEVLKRLNFANSDMCDNSQCQLQVGKMTPASKMIVPTVSKLGDKYILNARVIDIQRADIDFSTETKLVCKEDELDELVDDASYDLREKFGEKVVRPHPSAQAQAVQAPASSPSASGASSENQDLLGIVVSDDLSDAEKRNYGSGVKIKSISPNSPCRGALEAGNIISYMNPQGTISRFAAGPYRIEGMADFQKLAADIKPGGTVGFLLAGNIIRSASCKLPAQGQSEPASSPRAAAPAPRPQKRAASP
jgi:TolB-like protein